MPEINSLSIVDASNTARFPEGQAPSTVNDGARGLEGMLARWHRDNNGSLSISGAVNTWAVAMNQSFSASVSAFYVGLSVVARCNTTVTGATTFAPNGAPARNVRKNNAEALVANDVRSGDIFRLTWDGTNWQLSYPYQTTTALQAATAAEVSAGSSTTVAITPGRQQFHQSAAKAWVNFAGDNGSIRDSFNVSSVSDNGTGDYTVNFTVAMGNANYVVIPHGTRLADAGSLGPSAIVFANTSLAASYSRTTTAVRMYMMRQGGGDADNSVLVDADHVNVVVFGDH